MLVKNIAAAVFSKVVSLLLLIYSLLLLPLFVGFVFASCFLMRFLVFYIAEEQSCADPEGETRGSDNPLVNH